MANCKYTKQAQYVSYDGGVTWSPTGVYRRGSLIETGSADCEVTPTSGNYLTFIASESGTFKFIGNSIQYSTDSGNTWSTLASNVSSPTISSGQKIMWKATLSPSMTGVGHFTSTNRYSVEGNVMSIVYGDDYVNQTSLSGKDNCFYHLFYGSSGLTDASGLLLAATELSSGAYYGMFQNCTNLSSAPQLPATQLASNCYRYMFASCENLVSAPALPAMTMAQGAYGFMYYNCKRLQYASALPATTLAQSCYANMYQDCIALEMAPALPSLTLAQQCYTAMFYGCTNLQTAPTLPATQLAANCYSYMFKDCSSMTTAPDLMVQTLAESCYQQMFENCVNVSAIKCMALNFATNATQDWVNGVSPSGTFTRDCNATWSTGVSGKPNGWNDVCIDQSTTAITYNANEKLNVNLTAFTPAATAETFSNGVGQIEFSQSVTNIGYNAFRQKAMTSIKIPNSVTSISDNAFYNVTGLTTINIPSSVTSIGDWAFFKIQTLTDITIPSGVTVISSGLLANCTNLTGLTILGNITKIGSEAFEACSSLPSFTIPSGVTEIGDYAFYNAPSLTSITVNATTPPTLGNSVFANTSDCPIYVPCASKTAYQTAWSEYASRIMCLEPKMVATYSDSTTFSAATCDNTRVLERTEVRAHTTSYTAMTSAVISDCVTRIGTSAFGQCTSLTAVTIPNSVTSFSSAAFSKCSSLQSLTLPQATNAIGVWSFEGCTSLTTLSIPNATQYINQGAFQNCSGLTSVSIGTGVTLVDSDAFKGCSSLTSITINATTPPTLGEGAFDNTNNCTIYVPSANVNTYKLEWSAYESRIQAIE